MTTIYAELHSRVHLHTLLNRCDAADDAEKFDTISSYTPARLVLGALSARVRESTARELSAVSGAALLADVGAALVAERAGDGGAALKALAVRRMRAAARGESTLPPRAAVYFCSDYRPDDAHLPANPAALDATAEPAATAARETRRAAARSALVTSVARARLVASRSVLAEWAAMQNASAAVESTVGL